MKKNISVWCPCGYCVKGFKRKAEGILELQKHVEKFHKDILPFGITNKEALEFLSIEYIKSKEKSKIIKVSSTELLV